MRTFLFTLLALAITGVSAFGADTPQPPADAQMQEAMKAWMQFATPGENHKVLADAVGKWKYTSKWWQTATAKPEESKGTSTFKWILGGRYLQQDVKGKAMGRPFEGMAITGYDNLKGKYQNLWLDNMGTGFTVGTGTFDPATKTLTDKGEYSDPTAPSKTRTYRSEWKWTDKNNHIFSMYTTDMDGKEYKQMEMAYQRAK
jgi:hypothetical protein